MITLNIDCTTTDEVEAVTAKSLPDAEALEAAIQDVFSHMTSLVIGGIKVEGSLMGEFDNWKKRGLALYGSKVEDKKQFRKDYYRSITDGKSIATLSKEVTKRYAVARKWFSRHDGPKTGTTVIPVEIVEAGLTVFTATKADHNGNTTKVLREALKASIAADKAAKANG